jgi:hypothetical protein
VSPGRRSNEPRIEYGRFRHFAVSSYVVPDTVGSSSVCPIVEVFQKMPDA